MWWPATAGSGGGAIPTSWRWWLSGVAWCDESGFVGEDDGLGAVAQGEFGEDAGDVGFDGGFAEGQFAGDAGVGQAVSDEGEDVSFPGGQRGEVAVERG